MGKQGPFILNFKTDFSSRFQIENLGPVSWLLGCKIERDRPNRILRISQGQFITDTLGEFKMTTALVAGTLLQANFSKDQSTNEPLDKTSFHVATLIGKLMCCSNYTKPGITMAVNHLSRYMTSATVRHWEQTTRVLRYLSRTLQHSIIFNGKLPPHILMWQDFSFVDGEAQRSRT